MKTLSIYIIAQNEETCLGRALKSVQDIADEIIVVTDVNFDRTVDIAKEFGASQTSVRARRAKFGLIANFKPWVGEKISSEKLKEWRKKSFYDGVGEKYMKRYHADKEFRTKESLFSSF